MTRLACLVVPLFPLAARLRCEPELIHEALAIFEGNGNAARLVAATRPARRAGLKPGLTLPQARLLLPKLTARPRDAECERSAREALIEAAETISPRGEEGPDGVVYLDILGLDRLYAEESHGAQGKHGTREKHRSREGQIGVALMAATQAEGLPTKVGIASSKLAARVAADSPGSPTIVAAGGEAQFLAPLPLTRLAPEAEVASVLDRWGIRSIGELARLPAAEIASRLGRTGSELHSIARGFDAQPLTPRRPSPTFREGMTLEWPLVSLEPFLFVGRAALDRLSHRLRARGLACKRLEVSLRLEPDGHYERAIELPAPTRDTKTLLTLVRLELEARPPGAPVAGFSLTAHPDRSPESQLSLFGPATLSPDRLAATLARLFALLGPDRVGSPKPLDSHRPEGFRLEAYTPPPPPEIEPSPPRGRGLLGARTFRPPIPLEVLVAGGPQDEELAMADTIAEPVSTYGSEPAPPPAVRLLSITNHPGNTQEAEAEGTKAVKRPTIRGKVRVASGPWNLEEEWWSEHPVERDYWDVELSDGGIYRIYQERRSREWFADGMYD